MNEKDVVKIKYLVSLLNKYSDAYYNGTPIATDEEYDKMYEELKSLEKRTNIVFSNSPINKVGYEVKSQLDKIEHVSPMLSLDKIHSVDDIIKFKGDKNIILSLKEDGLTVRLTYRLGKLFKAETRGDGKIGMDITHNVSAFLNVPMSIDCMNELIVDGEAIIKIDDFEKINDTLDEKYKMPRSLVSGSVSLLDANETKNRRISFIAWRCVKGFIHTSIFKDFMTLEKLGFDVVPHEYVEKDDEIEKKIKLLQLQADIQKHPIDGIVCSYDDKEYGDSLGQTEHHFNHSIAYKFEDKAVDTKIINIEWSIGKTGVLTPVAIFEPIDIDGSEVERASCHNITYLRNMKLGIGDTVGVIKSNMIIPQIKVNYTNKNNIVVPDICPYCGEPTIILKDNDTEVLCCTNNECSGKILGRFSHFVSKSAMNIDGVSESILETLINNDLVHQFKDLYYLEKDRDIMLSFERFGAKKVDNLLKSIEKSRKCDLSNYIVSWSIPLVGKTGSKIISKICNGDYSDFVKKMDSRYDWTKHDGFGVEMNTSLYKVWDEYSDKINELANEMTFNVKKDDIIIGHDVFDLEKQTFCITGKLEIFENRDALVSDIEKHNGLVVSGVSKKTNYLITNDTTSGSSKNKKAAELNIPIITEKEYLEMVKM